MIIYLDVNPPTAWGKNSKSAYGGYVTESKSIKDTKALLVGLLVDKRPDTMLVGPMKLHVMVCWPYKATEKKSVVKAGSLIPKITKPDGDNVLATIKDTMEKLQFYKNDAEIYCEHIERWYGPKGFIRIELEEAS